MGKYIILKKLSVLNTKLLLINYFKNCDIKLSSLSRLNIYFSIILLKILISIALKKK